MVEAINPSDEKQWVGIDLGTKNSCIGYYTGSTVEIIQNVDDNANITPSVVLIKSNKDKIEVIVGSRAQN